MRGQEELDVLLVVDEVEPLAVHDQERGSLERVEVSAVRVGEACQVLRRDPALEVHAAPMHAFDQRVDGRLQIDDEVRRGRLRLQVRIDLLVESVLGIGQVEPREQRVLVEQEIADRQAAEHVELADPGQLVRALEQERELGREGEAGHVAVEALEERILLGALEELLAVDVAREHAGEARLAGADRAFDDDVTATLEVHRDCRAGARQRGKCERVRATRWSRTARRKRRASPRPGIVAPRRCRRAGAARRPAGACADAAP